MNITDLIQIGASIFFIAVIIFALTPCLYETIYPRKKWQYWNYYFSKEEMKYYDKLQAEANKDH